MSTAAAKALPPAEETWATPTYELKSGKLGVSVQELFEFLLEPTHSVDMHPLIISAKCIQAPLAVEGDPDLLTTVNEYTDKMAGGLWHMTYKGQFWYKASDHQVIRLRVQPGLGIRIETEWRLTPAPTEDGAPPASFLTQRTTVHGPPLVRGYVASTARAAHEHTLAKMEDRMPYPPPAHVTNAAPA